MAKVMISLPDALLARVDAHASEHGNTRSGAIRELTEAAFGERERQLAQRMAELDGHATGHGGNAVEELKRGRPG
jgi:metal-responsive CopG/Arc/MetJ family transcriptional regulator